jgi:purine-binding chemotaxis protein CheW
MRAAALEARVNEEQLVAFCLAGEIYGIAIACINEIIRPREITPIPRAADEIEGVINLRGKVVPILDLRRRLGLPPVERSAITRIIVVEVAESMVGLIVDEVIGVLRIAEADIEPPTALLNDLDSSFLRGVGKSGDKLVILLHIEQVLHLT